MLQVSAAVFEAQVLYTGFAQKFSVAQMFHDPDKAHGFVSKGTFLPIVNGLVNGTGDKCIQNSSLNLGALDVAVFAGGPDDGVIFPWQSEVWGFCREFDGSNTLVSIESTFSPCPQGFAIFNETPAWDSNIGFQSLHDDGKVKFVILPGISHDDWLHNDTVFDRVIEPYVQ